MSLFSSMMSRLGYAPIQAEYEGGKITRRNQSWRPRNRAQDAEVYEHWDLLTARGRWLGQNNPWCVGAKTSIADDIIGKGIRTKANVKDTDSKPLRDWNTQADELYERWMCEADVSGQQHWYEMTRTNLFGTVESGAGFLVERALNDPNRLVPLCWEEVEPDQLDKSRDRPAGGGQNEIRRGIEIDANRRPVAYWLYTTHPNDLHPLKIFSSERIPAERVLQLYRRDRPNQVTGSTWFAPIIIPLWNLYEYQSCEIDAAKIQSYFIYLWKRETGQGQGIGLGDEDRETSPEDLFGNQMEPLSPGIALEGGIQDDLKMIQGTKINGDVVPWLKLFLQTISVGMSIGYAKFTGDFSERSFSSHRAEQINDNLHLEPRHEWHVRHIDLPVRQRATRQFIGLEYLALPKVGIAGFNRNPWRWLQCKALPLIDDYLNPKEEISAQTDAISSGQWSFTRSAARLGMERDELFDELEDDLEAMEARPHLVGKFDHLFEGKLPVQAPGTTGAG